MTTTLAPPRPAAWRPVYDELSRRGFLAGLGAAGLLTACGSAPSETEQLADLGLVFVELDSEPADVNEDFSGAFSETLSLEEAGKYPADLILLDRMEAADMAGVATWAALPAVQAGQFAYSDALIRWTYDQQADELESVATAARRGPRSRVRGLDMPATLLDRPVVTAAWTAISFGTDAGQFSLLYPSNPIGVTLSDLGVGFVEVILHPVAPDGSVYPDIQAVLGNPLFTRLPAATAGRVHGMADLYDVTDFSSGLTALTELESTVLSPA